jgi:tRNA-splicing ligase RtcB
VAWGYDVEPVKKTLAELLARKIPAGLGSRGKLHLNKKQMDEVLAGGARWAVERGYGTKQDLLRIEEQGAVSGADPAQVSDQAKKRQEDEVGTLGSGNHYLEVQQVTEIYSYCRGLRNQAGGGYGQYSLWLAGPRSSNSY